jgi:hypothetical protein
LIISVLQKAFRRDFPQDAAAEPASKLLERIRAGRSSSPAIQVRSTDRWRNRHGMRSIVKP